MTYTHTLGSGKEKVTGGRSPAVLVPLFPFIISHEERIGDAQPGGDQWGGLTVTVQDWKGLIGKMGTECSTGSVVGGEGGMDFSCRRLIWVVFKETGILH